MDVAKAKNVVIALLVAFNIFLLVNNLTFVKGQGVQKETIRNTEVVLEMRGVTLECDIPTKPGGLHRLEYINDKLDRQALAEVLLGSEYEETGQEAINVQGAAAVQAYEFMSGSRRLRFISDTEFVYTDDMTETQTQSVAVDLGSDDRVKKAAQQFLESAGLMQGKYVVDRLVRNEDGSAQIDFIETYDGFLVFDNYCSVTLDKMGVRRLEYGKVHVNGFSHQSIERFDAYQALLSHFKADSNLTITAIDSGYKLPDSSMDGVETVEMLPVWRVKIKGSSRPEYIYPYDSEKVNNDNMIYDNELPVVQN